MPLWFVNLLWGLMSEDDFSAFCAAARPRLLRALTLIAGNTETAEDALQEAFIRAAARWNRLDEPEAWVRRVAVNLLHDRRRRLHASRRAHLRHGPAANVPDHEPTTVLVVAALRELTPNQRQVIALYYLLDLSVQQIAADLDMPDGTVKAHLSRGRARLTELLASEKAHR